MRTAMSLTLQELRTGNLVNYEATTHIVRVIGDFVSGMEYVYSNWVGAPDERPLYLAMVEEYSGIEPSEEWLIADGFVECYNSHINQNFELDSNPIIGVHTCKIDGRMMFRYEGFYRPFKYLHQLQNLFFSIKGTELEFKQYPSRYNRDK